MEFTSRRLFQDTIIVPVLQGLVCLIFCDFKLLANFTEIFRDYSPTNIIEERNDDGLERVYCKLLTYAISEV